MHRVVVVGGGFGGLQAVKALRRAPVEITLVDRNNYHLFQPLTYEVATAGLSPDEVSEPLRRIFKSRVDVVMGEVTGFDLERKRVLVQPDADDLPARELPYDSLVVAGGSSYSYFGHDEWRPLALEVKSLESALAVRGHILGAFEAAELQTDEQARAALLTFVVVGAGPTGVEMAGQIAELFRDTVPRDFRTLQRGVGRVLLVEATDRILPAFPPSLSKRARRSLERLGVTPLTERTVVGIQPDAVEVRGPNGDTERVPCRTVIWAAGVTASPLAGELAQASGAEVGHGGRLVVDASLTLPGHPEVFAIGDMVAVEDQELPGVAPVAMQQGRYAGRAIRDGLRDKQTPPFHYRDKGNLATIGRGRAVADLPGRVRLSGLPAWVIWLGVHILYLIGFQNRLVVLLRWAYYFFTRNRGARIILRESPAPARTSRGGP
jgi:NADH:ubiquinone reductase (H+-translocating)